MSKVRVSWLLAAVAFGAFLGACFKDAVRSEAHAQAATGGGAGKYRYQVIGPSMSLDGYQQDMNEWANKGWRFVGAIQGGLVFEQER